MKDEKNVKKGFETVLRVKDKSTSKELAEALLYSICSYLFGCGEAVFGTYPFGMAFMCAVRRHVPFSIAGVMLSFLVRDGSVAISFCGLFASAVFRYCVAYAVKERDRFDPFYVNDTPLCRICASGVGMLTVTVLSLISDDLTYYGLFAVFAGVFLGMFMTYVYCLALDGENKYTQRYEAGIGAVFFSCVVALRSFHVLGTSLGGICAFLFPVYTSRKTGALKGTVIGALCGAALDISLCPAFAALGFVCGVLPSAAVTLSVVSGVFAFGFFGLYSTGFDTVVKYLPEAIIASGIYVPLEKLHLLPKLSVFKDESVYKNAVSPDRIANKYALEAYENDLSSLSRSLDGISGIMHALSDVEKRPAVHEICSLCEKEFSSFCKKCSMKKLCFPNGVRGSSCVRQCAESIYEKGLLSTSHLPEKIKTGCYFAEKLTANVNMKLAEYNSEKIKNNKTEIMAEDLARFSQFIENVANERRTHDKFNAPLTERLKKIGGYKHLFGDNVAVYGEERLTVIACGADSLKIRSLSAEIQKNFGKILGVLLDKCSFSECDGFTAAVFKMKEKYKCAFSSLQTPKDGETINGDSVLSFSADGKFYTCICDGMGSGQAAALASKPAGIFLKNMLTCCSDTEGVLKMLNHFIRNQRGECFTTVDIMCVDLISGKGSFVKSGASPSYVIRDGRIFRMASNTPPVGIMEKLCSERIDFAFKKDDIAVMVSDGIADDSDELVWLYNLLTYESGCTPEQLCEKIMERACTEHLGEDDMTVSAVCISLA